MYTCAEDMEETTSMADVFDVTSFGTADELVLISHNVLTNNYYSDFISSQ